MKQRKPKITFGPAYYFGIRGKSFWWCACRDAFGFGETPMQAYQEWRKDLPKSFFSKAGRRFADWIL